MLECPLYNSIGNNLFPLLQNVVLGTSLKSYFQLGHQFDISLKVWYYLNKAITLCYTLLHSNHFDTILMYI